MYRSGRFLALAIACTCGLGAIAFFKYSSQVEKHKQEEEGQLSESLSDAERLLAGKHPLRALEILNSVEFKISGNPLLEQKWKLLALDIAMTLEDDQLLYKLWMLEPSYFDHHEKLSLKVATHALSHNDLENYKQIAKNWQAEGKEGQSWFLLEADALILQGETEKATAFLHAASLHGNQEILRLIRLALLNENEHPKVAWNYLLKALKINPNDPDLHLYRAQLLESAKKKELAVEEYKKATAKSQKNSFYTEELVNFFIRQHQYKEALSLINASTLTSDVLRLKALFLEKVFLGKGNPIEFWNLSWEKLAGSEAEWLKVFQNLKSGHDKKAFDILQNHPEMAELNFSLYEGLKKAIAMQHPYLKDEETVVIENPIHPVFSLLCESIHSDEYVSLFKSKDCYAALALASGWSEAALNLRNSSTALSSAFPKWVAHGYAKALISNRSKEEALSFIQKQVPTPQLYLLAGELNLQLQRYDEAEKIFSTLAKKPGHLGQKAALLLSKTYASQNSFLKARNAVLDNHSLAESVAGKESLARLELVFGDATLAEKMYAEISEHSTEAKSYLAKKAFDKKDYPTAYKLTKHLVEQFPERNDLKVQLGKINQAMKS